MSLYVSGVKRGGNYNEEIGLDIDGSIVGEIGSAPSGLNYYDYDLLSRPSVSGSGIMIPGPVDAGFPSIDDYVEVIYPDGSKGKQLKKFMNDDQSGSFSVNMMTDKINNGRLNDVKVVQEMPKENAQIIINKDNTDTAIKGLLEHNAVNDIFFSEMNTKVIQDTIRYKVHQYTQQVISEQSSNDLYIIMRSIMLQFANFRSEVDNVVPELKRLNAKVVDYAAENISSNVKQHKGYIDDLSKLPVPLDAPVYQQNRNYTYDISNLL